MKQTERRTIAFHFQELGAKIQALYEEVGDIAGRYPRIRQQEDAYLNLRDYLKSAEEEAQEMQTRILESPDEDWAIELKEEGSGSNVSDPADDSPQ